MKWISKVSLLHSKMFLLAFDDVVALVIGATLFTPPLPLQGSLKEID